MPRGQPTPESHQPLTQPLAQPDTELLSYKQGHWQVRKKNARAAVGTLTSTHLTTDLSVSLLASPVSPAVPASGPHHVCGTQLLWPGFPHRPPKSHRGPRVRPLAGRRTWRRGLHWPREQGGPLGKRILGFWGLRAQSRKGLRALGRHFPHACGQIASSGRMWLKEGPKDVSSFRPDLEGKDLAFFLSLHTASSTEPSN